jgi:hypothetical protein
MIYVSSVVVVIPHEVSPMIQKTVNHSEVAHSVSPRRRGGLVGVALSAVMMIAVISCGGSESPVAARGPNTLLDTTVDLVQGVNCNTGGVAADFIGKAGITVKIDGSGPTTLTPQLGLYAPDYSTLLAGSAPAGAGKATFTLALAQNGTYHLNACDTKGVGGRLRLTVTQQ